MPTYTAYLPVYATAKFTLTTDEPIPDNELVERFRAESESNGALCHQCSNDIESDFEIDERAEIGIEDITVKQ